jgi:hypothetical protein
LVFQALETKERYEEGLSTEARRERRNSLKKRKRERAEKDEASDGDFEV